MPGKCQQLSPNPEKENNIVQPVEVAQVAAAVTLQDHLLRKEDLKNRKDLLQILLKPIQMLKLNCWYSNTADIKFDQTEESFKRYWRTGCPNHSTGDQSPTGNILSQIDLEEDVDCQTGPKISESLAKRVEFKWKTKLTLDQLKEKSKNLLVPEIAQSYLFHLQIKKCSHSLLTPRKKLTHSSRIYKRISSKPAEPQKAVSNHFPRQEPMVEILFCTRAQINNGDPPNKYKDH